MAGEIKQLVFAEGTTVSEPSTTNPLVIGDPTNTTTHAINGNYLTSIGAGLKNKLNATAAPAATDDNPDGGYSVGSLWIDVTNDRAYVCVDSTNDAAVWKEIDSPRSNFTATTNPTASDDTTEYPAYNVGSLWVNTSTDTVFICVDATTDAAIWQEVGSGSGAGGGKNYLTGDDTDANTTVGNWVAYADAAGTSPVDGTGGSPTTTFTRNTTTPLRDEGDFKLAKDAANRQGEGASVDFTVDRADLASVMRIEFDYDASDTDYADDDIAVYIYDKDGTSLIEPVGKDLKAGKGTHVCYFQTHNANDDYRLILHITSTNAAAYDIYFDRVSVGPATRTFSAPITDYKSFTPTGDWSTNTTYSGYWRRVGDSVEVIMQVATSGAPDAVSLLIDVPPGMTIDTSKILDNGETLQVGTCILRDGTTNYMGAVSYSSSTQLRVRTVEHGASYVGTGTVTNLVPFTWGASDYAHIIYKVPIQGWSSQVQMSDEADTREIYASGAGNGGTAITANTTNVDFTEVSDSHGVFDGTTFTVPVSGRYVIHGRVLTTATMAGILAYIDGNSDKLIGYVGTETSVGFHAILDLTAGQALTIRLDATKTLSNSTTQHYIHIQKMQGPSAIAANETVALYAINDSGSHTSSGSYLTLTSWDTPSINTHGGFSSGVYTIPVSGTYRVSSAVAMSASGTGERVLRLYKNGATQLSFAEQAGNASYQLPAVTSILHNFVAGDTIQVDVFQNSGGTLAYSTNTGATYLAINRIGF